MLGPFFIGVIMTTGTLKAYPQKNLTEYLGHLLRRTLVAIHHGGTKSVRTPAGSNHIACKLIHWLVFTKCITQPLVQYIHTLEPGPVRIRAHEVRPLVCPVVGICRIRQKSINHPRALISRPVRHIDTRFLQSWQPSNRVQRGSSKELLVRTQLARQ